MFNHSQFLKFFFTFLIFFSEISYAAFLQDYLREPLTPLSSVANKNYQLLNEQLALYENAITHPWPIIPANKKLKLGVKNKNVVLLRDRLKATHDLPAYEETNNTLFDVNLETAVKIFQERNGLNADGIVGKRTLYELNIPASERVKQIEINLQRWANLGSDLPTRFILVNIPEYQLHLYENDQEILTMKAIVGKPTRQTPELKSTITTLVFNPYWNVPHSIAQKDIVPKVLADPDYLNDMHIKILENQEEDAVEINAEEIDWQAALDEGFSYHFRQEPGNDNALGLVKFEFQNSHDIYLHDTPAKNLFDQDQRLLSSGCIRLENPFALVDYLMKNNPIWSEEKIEDVINSGNTTYAKISKPIPIFIVYLTAWVDQNGLLNFRDDVYQKDNE